MAPPFFLQGLVSAPGTEPHQCSVHYHVDPAPLRIRSVSSAHKETTHVALRTSEHERDVGLFHPEILQFHHVSHNLLDERASFRFLPLTFDLVFGGRLFSGTFAVAHALDDPQAARGLTVIHLSDLSHAFAGHTKLSRHGRHIHLVNPQPVHDLLVAFSLQQAMRAALTIRIRSASRAFVFANFPDHGPVTTGPPAAAMTARAMAR